MGGMVKVRVESQGLFADINYLIIVFNRTQSSTCSKSPLHTALRVEAKERERRNSLKWLLR